MITILLLIAGSVCVLGVIGIFLLQKYQLEKGVIVVDNEYNGPKQVSLALRTVIRFALKKSIHARKFFMQYVLHIMVRFTYYFDVWTAKLYAKSRNWFVHNAVKNKGTVPHFWEHLKVYKKEMDEERDEVNN